MSKKKKPTTEPEPLAHIVADLRSLAVPIAELAADPTNARVHGEANLRAIAGSLKRFGQRKPLVANRTTGQLEAGHGTLAAAVRLGWSQLAVVWVEDDPTTARGFALADNHTAALAGWDDEKLETLLAETRRDTPELFDDLLLDELAGGTAPGGGVELKPLAVQKPPAMTWVLVGVPTVRFDQVAATVEELAALDGVIVETTVADGPDVGADDSDAAPVPPGEPTAQSGKP